MFNFAHEAGVYRITNMVNGKVYIGQSRRMTKRIAEHLGLKHPRRNPHFSAAIARYGRAVFCFDVLLYAADQTNLDAAERWAIDSHNARDPKRGYNLREGGNGTQRADSRAKQAATLRAFFLTPAGEAQKARQREARKTFTQTEEARAKIGAWNRGRKRPDGTGAKIGAKLRGKPKTIEHKAKLAQYRGALASMSGRKHSPESITKMREARYRYWARRSA